MKRNRIDWIRVAKKVSPYQIKKGILYLRKFGAASFMDKFTNRFQAEEISYREFREQTMPGEAQLEAQRTYRFTNTPKISVVVPLYRTDRRLFRELVESIRFQTYGNWELCLADGSGEDEELQRICEELVREDGRIRYEKLEENFGIVGNTNRALAMASGEYIGFLDHDDVLSPDALYELVKVLEKHPDAELIYSDEDKMSADGSEFSTPHFKPDYSPDLLRSNNYICHFLVVSAGLLKRIGGLREEFEGAQDHDFVLRCTEETDRIFHIPKVLYHWREHPGSTADNPFSKSYAYEAGRRAVTESLRRQGIEAQVEETDSPGFYRVRYPVIGQPLVSIIIPNKDHVEDLRKCLTSIFEKTTYGNYEIIIVDNGSTDPELKNYYQELQGKVRFLRFRGKFNFSILNNYAAEYAKGSYFLFLNNDTEVIAENWIEEMLSNCQRTEVGITGARLLYPDHTVQHAGIVIGMGDFAGALFTGLESWRSGYFHRAVTQQNLSAVTAAAMMISREVFEAVGGFEERLPVAFNDVDLCLKVRGKELLVVYDPWALLYHAESKSRGAEDTKEKLDQFHYATEFMKNRYAELLENGDPYYNPNLSLKKWDYSLADPKDL